MKVAIVQYSSSLDGSAISGLMIAKGLLEREWEVEVILGAEGPLKAELKDRCSVSVIPHKNPLRRHGIYRFVRDILTEHRRSLAFEGAFEQSKPDLVYINSLVSYSASVAAKRLQIPVVWHIRELFSDAGGEMVWPSLLPKYLLRRWITSVAAQVVVNSGAVAGNIFGSKFSRGTVRINNGVPPSFFSERGDKDRLRGEMGLPLGRPLVGLPGTFRPVKGHEFLLRAIPEVVRKIPDCCIALTGSTDSSYASEVMRKINDAPFADRVFFTGNIRGMERFYHACDVCCVPSSSESFGRTAIECMASRTPFVASAVGGLKEIVSHDQNGLLVPYGDVPALAEALISLLTDTDRVQRLVQQGVVDARQKYSEQAYVEKVVEVINRAF